jgi:hypothetical protein
VSSQNTSSCPVVSTTQFHQGLLSTEGNYLAQE